MRKLTEEECHKRLEGRPLVMLNYGGNAAIRKSTFKCNSCSYTWDALFSSVNTGKGCPKCANAIKLTEEVCRERLIGRNIVLKLYGGNTSVKSSFGCKICEYEWSTAFVDVDFGKKGCPKCANNVNLLESTCHERLKGRNLVMSKYAGSTHGKSKFKCFTCHTEWCAMFINVERGSGCPSCSKSGFNPIKPAWVYRLLLDTAEGMCYGFGITNNLQDRLKYHKNNLGNILDQEYEPLYFDSGVDASTLENNWKQSPYKVNIGIKGFKTECVLVNSETTKMIFG